MPSKLVEFREFQEVMVSLDLYFITIEQKTVSDSTHLWHELSLAPRELFPSDFFVVKVQTKLYLRKILDFLFVTFSSSNISSERQHG